jgi:hypothetical protein
LPDADLDVSRDPDPRMSSVHRWRPAFQADFQARLDWCVRPFAEANHPPVVRIAGDRARLVAPGAVVDLDAGESIDPDGDALDFHWRVYPTDPAKDRPIVIQGSDGARASLVADPTFAGRSIPILVSVTDRGEPRLTRYGRVLIRVAETD